MLKVSEGVKKNLIYGPVRINFVCIIFDFFPNSSELCISLQ